LEASVVEAYGGNGCPEKCWVVEWREQMSDDMIDVVMDMDGA